MAIYRGAGGPGDATVDAANEAAAAVNAAAAAQTSAINAANSAAAALVSQNNAATSEENASNSEANAAASASSALSSANTATDAANDAINAANSASDSEINAAASEDAAHTYALSAAGSASAAATSAANALISEENAAASELAAQEAEENVSALAYDSSLSIVASDLAGTGFDYDFGSVDEAATPPADTHTSYIKTVAENIDSVIAAVGAAEDAAASASDAADSAVAAAASELAAATSASNAADSETNAAASALAASGSASDAADSADAASASALAAATSESNAATSETNAYNSASAAATSESNAAISEDNAYDYATSASAAQVAAESARDATLAAYDSFDDRYLGAKASDPTLDNDGNALIAGALYFDSTLGYMKVYTGSAWVPAYVSASGILLAANNLSDLTSVSTARTNLGLGTAATTDSTAYATASQGTNADTAYGWGNHASAGYLTTSSAASTYQPLDADLTAIAGISATSGLLKKTATNTWSLDTNTYLTSYTETDPVYTASSWYSTTNNASNWNTAYSERQQWDGGSTNLNASTGRTSLGLGSIATQAASNVALTGGTINGIIIGGTTAAAGTFTDLTVTGTFDCGTIV